ncbi:MAG: GAF domain-containing protein, partial [Chloroflexota bacterium]
MMVQDRIIGLITLDKLEPDYYSQSDAETAFALARQAAIAVENARLFESEQERRQVADTLIDVGRTVAAKLQLDEVLVAILVQMQRVVNYDGATLQLNVGAETGASLLRLRAIRGQVRLVLGSLMRYPENSIPHLIYSRRRPMILDDVLNHSNWEAEIDLPFERMPIRGWMGVPMMVQDRIIGLITLDKFEP